MFWEYTVRMQTRHPELKFLGLFLSDFRQFLLQPINYAETGFFNILSNSPFTNHPSFRPILQLLMLTASGNIKVKTQGTEAQAFSEGLLFIYSNIIDIAFVLQMYIHLYRCCCCYMIYLLTAIGLSPGGSSTVHIYTQTIHRTTPNKQYIEQHNNLGECGPCPVLSSYTLAFALQMRKIIKILSQIYIGVLAKYLLFLSDFNETSIFSTDFRKILKYQISCKAVQSESSYSKRMDGQTDMTQAIVALRNFANTPKKRSSEGHIYFTVHTEKFLAEFGNILTCKLVTPSFHWLPLLGKDLGTGVCSFTTQLPSFPRKSTPTHYSRVGVGSIFSVHSYALKMEAADSSETLVPIRGTKRHHTLIITVVRTQNCRRESSYELRIWVKCDAKYRGSCLLRLRKITNRSCRIRSKISSHYIASYIHRQHHKLTFCWMSLLLLPAPGIYPRNCGIQGARPFVPPRGFRATSTVTSDGSKPIAKSSKMTNIPFS